MQGRYLNNMEIIAASSSLSEGPNGDRSNAYTWQNPANSFVRTAFDAVRYRTDKAFPRERPRSLRRGWPRRLRSNERQGGCNGSKKERRKAKAKRKKPATKARKTTRTQRAKKTRKKQRKHRRFREHHLRKSGRKRSSRGPSAERQSPKQSGRRRGPRNLFRRRSGSAS